MAARLRSPSGRYWFLVPSSDIFLIIDSSMRRTGVNVKRIQELKSIDLCVTSEWQTKCVSPVGQVMLPASGNATCADVPKELRLG